MRTRTPAAKAGMVALVLVAGLTAVAAALGILSSGSDPAVGVLNPTEPPLATSAEITATQADLLQAPAPEEPLPWDAGFEDHDDEDHDDHDEDDDHDDEDHDDDHGDRRRGGDHDDD